MQVAVVMVLYITRSLDECQGSSPKKFLEEGVLAWERGLWLHCPLRARDMRRLPGAAPLRGVRCARTSPQMQEGGQGFVSSGDASRGPGA